MESPSPGDVGAPNIKRQISSRIPKRQSSISGTPRKYNGLNKSAPDSEVGRKSTVLVRKKLPWLDGPRIPGQFDSKESLVIGNRNDQPPPVPEKDPPTPPKRTSASSLGADPALRAVGSTPSLRKETKRQDFRPLSLSSQPRPGIKPVASKLDVKKVLGVVNEGPKPAEYNSSLYSVTPSADKDESPPALPKQEASSYERLIEKQTAPNAELNRNPFRISDEWLQSYADLSPEGPVSPRNSIDPVWWQLEIPVSPMNKTKIPRNHQRSDSCKSCGPGPPVRSQLRDMPNAKTLPRRSVASSPSQPLQPPSPPTRKPTLYAMPTHLLPSSSSSSAGRLRRVSAQAVPALEQAPPTPPPQTAKRQDIYRQSQSLNRAVTGLENLMEEALNVARNAAHNGRNDEVADVLDNATLALRKASTVNGRLNDGRMSQPLVLSPAVSERDSDSDSSVGPHSDVSSTHSRGHSFDTAPTLLTKSAQSSQQPILLDQRKASGKFPGTLKPSVESFEDTRNKQVSRDRHSMSLTPPRLYQPPSADSIVRDFAYSRARTGNVEAARKFSRSHGSAADYYGDLGQSVVTQPGVRPSVSAPMFTDKPLPNLPEPNQRPSFKPAKDIEPPTGRRQKKPVKHIAPTPTQSIPHRISSRSWEKLPDTETPARRRHPQPHRHHLSDLFESPAYHQQQNPKDRINRGLADPPTKSNTNRSASLVTDTSGRPPPNLLQRSISLRHPRRKHISLNEGQGFSLGRYHRRQPIAREWRTGKKRITAMIACLNTVFVGLNAGIFAGEVPRIQYQLADSTHKVILGNVVLFACLGATTLIFWPLPLLHGRKPYTLISFALMLPLMFPQALVVSGYRSPNNPIYRCGLLIPRAFEGIAMGFANINFLPILFDLFGASLMSTQPHQEIVVYDDVRRQGGGMGIWLGIWSFCWVGSMSIGFCVGACIISALSPSWGFYIIVILLAFFLLVNVVAPETRRAPYRRSIAQFLDGDEKVKRRVARGEVKLHISNDGPKWWWEEVGAGLILTKRMMFQPGFFILMAYLGWMYAQVTLVILFLGALLSRDYLWEPQYVGPAVLSLAIGSFLALPLSKANLFSRARDTPQRTDSMTMQHHQKRVHWSSHMLRRCIFTLTLPFAAIAYTLSSPGPSVNWTTPTVFCGLVGFLSNLAIAECVGMIMETFDTSDLQPGVNQKHRLQSMAETTRRRRTNYSSFPRICAGFFAAQSLGFFLSAAATGVSGDITRAVGAQTATAIVAAILLVLTVLFIVVLWRWKEVQVIPNHVFGTKNWAGGVDWGGQMQGEEDKEWRPVVIGNPSGKMRRVSFLELGGLTRWSEIRRLNKLMK